MQTLLRDMRFALRQLRKHPGFSLVAALTLAIGIASSTAVFSLVDAVLLQPVPLPHPEQLLALDTISLKHAGRAGAQAQMSDDNSWMDFFDWRRENKSFAGIAGYHPTNGNIGRAGQPLRRVSGTMLSTGMMSVLGIAPQLGRDFQPEEELAGNRSIVLSEAWWKSEFGGSAAVVGSPFQMKEETYTVVDVLPGNLHSGQAVEIMELFRALNKQGTTVVQVTHSPANAVYGTRTIELRDGWLTFDSARPESVDSGKGSAAAA